MSLRSQRADAGGCVRQPVPVPDLMADCPVQGGLAVPAVAIRHLDPALPAVFGIDYPEQINACLTEQLCAVCGQPLALDPSGSYLLVLRPMDFARGYSSQPALHPACHDYSVRACPWLNGQMSSYRRTPRNLESLRCATPGCGCRRWRTPPDHWVRAGQPVPPVFAATYALEDYELDWGERHGHSDVLRGVRLAGIYPQVITPVRDGEWSLLDMMCGRLVGLPVPDTSLMEIFGLAEGVSRPRPAGADAQGAAEPDRP